MRWVVPLLAGLSLSLAAAASAQEEDPRADVQDEDVRRDAEGDADGDAQDDGAGSDDLAHRPVPDYGRPPVRHHPARGLLWVPRILLYPVHLLLEYGVRYPLGWALGSLERTGFDAVIERPGVRPTEQWEWWLRPSARYDHGFAPSVGLGLLAGTDGMRLGVALDFWGTDRVGGWAGLRAEFERTEVRFSLRGSYRADRLFQGLGWNASMDPPARYARGRGEVRLSASERLWRQTAVEVGARASLERFEASDYGERAVVANEATLRDVPGFSDGVIPLVLYTRAAIDTRTREQRRHGTGARLEAGGGWGVDAEQGPEASWARAWARAVLAVELRTDRTLALRGLAEVVEPLGDLEVPFTEQAWLGADLERMPGFLSGQLIGRSATLLGLRYRYALWAWLDAELFFDVGNVFGPVFEDFDVERLRMSFGAALHSPDRDSFTVLFALGTEPFVAGTQISTVRFAVGIGTNPSP